MLLKFKYASVSLIPHKATRFLTAEELYLHLFKKKKRNESHSVNRSMHSGGALTSNAGSHGSGTLSGGYI